MSEFRSLDLPMGAGSAPVTPWAEAPRLASLPPIANEGLRPLQLDERTLGQRYGASFDPYASYSAPGREASSFQRMLGRFGPVPPTNPALLSPHAAPWDYPSLPVPKTDGKGNHAKTQAESGLRLQDSVMYFSHPHQQDQRACDAPFSEADFSPDPLVDRYLWDGCGELDVYGGKFTLPTQRPWFECGWPLYGAGPLPPSETWLGVTNPIRRKFYVYGDFRTAVAYNDNIANSEAVWANRLNLEFDYAFTGTGRFHAFWGPLDQGQQFTGWAVNSGELDVRQRVDGWDQNTDTMYFEGDLGYLLGGLRGIDAPFDLPFAVGLIPLVFQNGIWLEDAFVGAAATIPARNSPGLDWSNFDTTFFCGFDELTTGAFPGNDNAKFVGATTFIERRGGYIELGYAFVDDPTNAGLSYHNVGLSYTRRYLNLVSNSARLILNAGQDGPQSGRTADGALLLLESSFLTANPYNVIPYCNLFAGFNRPQPLGRLQGPLKNTGINFESDLLTGYPTLDDSANDAYGAAVGVDLLGQHFDKQLIVEGATVQAFGNPAERIAPGDQYALGVRYQKRLNYCLLVRADAMYGWLENAPDISGMRLELRHKF